MPDYKQQYLDLFRASEQAIRILVQAQQAAEQAVLDAPPPPLRLPQGDQPSRP
ncbi:MAG: hypothetical protein IJ347_03770 [Faecalibacterium sp.]|nr:hypothetical protein [Faecalibacterium sp.]